MASKPRSFSGNRPAGLSQFSRFPADWPPGCPPHSTDQAHGSVYRIIKQVPPHADDFLSHREMGKKLPKADPCMLCGLSVFRSLDDAKHQRQLFQRLGKHIAQGELNDEHGLLKETPGKVPTHMTWWVYPDVDRAALFVLVREDA